MSAGTYDLTWRRVSPGLYVTSAPINGEAAAFQSRLTRGTGEGRNPDAGWRYSTMTYGRPLDSGSRRTLADAKAAAYQTYYAVESVNR